MSQSTGRAAVMVYAAMLFADGAVVGGAVVRRAWFEAAMWGLSGVMFALALWFSLNASRSRAVVAFIDQMQSQRMRDLHRMFRAGRPQ